MNFFLQVQHSFFRMAIFSIVYKNFFGCLCTHFFSSKNKFMIQS